MHGCKRVCSGAIALTDRQRQRCRRHARNGGAPWSLYGVTCRAHTLVARRRADPFTIGPWLCRRRTHTPTSRDLSSWSVRLANRDVLRRTLRFARHLPFAILTPFCPKLRDLRASARKLSSALRFLCYLLFAPSASPLRGPRASARGISSALCALCVLLCNLCSAPCVFLQLLLELDPVEEARRGSAEEVRHHVLPADAQDVRLHHVEAIHQVR